MPPTVMNNRMSERILVTGGLVLTMDDAREVHHGGAVVISGDKIEAVLAKEELAERRREFDDAKVIDASGCVVMPGLVDLHFHTDIERGGFSESLAVEAALFDHWYPMMRNLDAETAYWGAMYTYMSAIRAGTTTVNDMFRHVDACARAAADIGIRAMLSSLVARPEDGLDSLEDNAAAFATSHGTADGRVEVAIGVEWLPLATPGLLRGARELADSLNIGIHIHLSESQQEVASALEVFGARPVEVAERYGLLGPDCVAAHCVWLTEGDISILADTRTHVSHNPSSNAKLGEGISPVVELLVAGVNVGLGHDSTEGGNTMDMFDVMRTCGYLPRAVHADSTIISADQVLSMATRGGADALGHDTGVIAAGKKADVIVVDAQSEFFDLSHAAYRTSLPARLVFASHGSMVRDTIIDGAVVMEGREMKTVDAAAVARSTRVAIDEFMQTLGRDPS